MQLDKREIESSLMKKGFEKREKGDHTYFYHIYKGKETGIHTLTSRGSKYKSYGRELLGAMKKQLRLSTPAQLRDLVKCPMSGDNYNEFLKKIDLI